MLTSAALYRGLPALALASLLAPAAVGQTTVDAATADLTIDSTASASAFAEAVAVVPDLDGDGKADLAIGALAYDPLDEFGVPINNAGAVIAFSGETGAFIRRFEGTQRDANLGSAIVSLPDRDGDDVAELLVGASRTGNAGIPEVGALVLFSGATGAILDTAYGTNGERTSLGSSLALVGDLNDDGIPEVVAGAAGTGAGIVASTGFAVLYDGATLSELHTFSGEAPGAIFGRSVDGGGDLNGDGTPDIAVGAPLQETQSPGGSTMLDAGRIYAYSGADYQMLFAKDRFSNETETPFSNFGTSVSIVADIDGDGQADVVAGGPESQQGSGGNGFVTVYSGANGDVIHDIEGFFATGEQHGTRVLGLGDMDGDDVPDFAVSSSQQCFGFCSSRQGETIVYSGATGLPIFEYVGESNGDVFGGSLACGDVDGDGGNDLVIAAPFHSVSTGPGRVYVFNGPVPTSCPEDLDGDGAVAFADLTQLLSQWGACAGCPEDLDGDGAVAFADLTQLLGQWGPCPG
jgi:hypothetical protein